MWEAESVYEAQLSEFFSAIIKSILKGAYREKEIVAFSQEKVVKRNPSLYLDAFHADLVKLFFVGKDYKKLKIEECRPQLSESLKKGQTASVLSSEQIYALLEYLNKSCDLFGFEVKLSLFPLVPLFLLQDKDERLSEITHSICAKLVRSEKYVKQILGLFYKYNLKPAAKALSSCPNPSMVFDMIQENMKNVWEIFQNVTLLGLLVVYKSPMEGISHHPLFLLVIDILESEPSVWPFVSVLYVFNMLFPFVCKRLVDEPLLLKRVFRLFPKLFSFDSVTYDSLVAKNILRMAADQLFKFLYGVFPGELLSFARSQAEVRPFLQEKTSSLKLHPFLMMSQDEIQDILKREEPAVLVAQCEMYFNPSFESFLPEIVGESDALSVTKPHSLSPVNYRPLSAQRGLGPLTYAGSPGIPNAEPPPTLSRLQSINSTTGSQSESDGVGSTDPTPTQPRPSDPSPEVILSSTPRITVESPVDSNPKEEPHKTPSPAIAINPEDPKPETASNTQLGDESDHAALALKTRSSPIPRFDPSGNFEKSSSDVPLNTNISDSLRLLLADTDTPPSPISGLSLLPDKAKKLTQHVAPIDDNDDGAFLRPDHDKHDELDSVEHKELEEIEAGRPRSFVGDFPFETDPHDQRPSPEIGMVSKTVSLFSPSRGAGLLPKESPLKQPAMELLRMLLASDEGSTGSLVLSNSSAGVPQTDVRLVGRVCPSCDSFKSALQDLHLEMSAWKQDHLIPMGHMAQLTDQVLILQMQVLLEQVRHVHSMKIIQSLHMKLAQRNTAPTGADPSHTEAICQACSARDNKLKNIRNLFETDRAALLKKIALLEAENVSLLHKMTDLDQMIAPQTAKVSALKAQLEIANEKILFLETDAKSYKQRNTDLEEAKRQSEEMAVRVRAWESSLPSRDAAMRFAKKAEMTIKTLEMKCEQQEADLKQLKIALAAKTHAESQLTSQVSIQAKKLSEMQKAVQKQNDALKFSQMESNSRLKAVDAKYSSVKNIYRVLEEQIFTLRLELEMLSNEKASKSPLSSVEDEEPSTPKVDGTLSNSGGDENGENIEDKTIN